MTEPHSIQMPDCDEHHETENVDNIHGDDKHNLEFTPHARSKYAKFDKEKRKAVIFWCELTIFSLGVASCVASLSVPSLKKASLRGFMLWQLCLLITALLGGPLLSRAILRLILLFIDHEFSVQENVIYYVVGLVESAGVVLWFAIILLAWTWVVDEPSYLGVPHENKEKLELKFVKMERIITLTLITILLGSFLWLLKDLAIMIAKSSFHIRRFFDRIRESLMHQYMIKILSSHPRIDNDPLHDKSISWKKIDHVEVETPESCCRQMIEKARLGNRKTEKTSFSTTSQGREEKRVFDLTSLENVNQENVSCWGMKILIDEIITERPLIYVDKDRAEKEINTENDARSAAKIIFSNMFPRDTRQVQKSFVEENLKRYFSDGDQVSQVEQWLLEGADAQSIGEDVFSKCMVRAWKYRAALVRALLDNKTLFEQLNKAADVLLVIIIFIVWLVMLNVEVRRAMVVVGTAIVGSAFIFGDFCKKLLDNFAFVFVVHPFDVGDCCVIQDTPVIIHGINLLTTVALTLDDEMRHYPNSVLCGLTISNYTRSPLHMGDSVSFSLDINTPKKKIKVLKDDIESYFDGNSHFWHPEHELVLEIDVQDSQKMKATLHFKHKTNFHDLRERQTRKTKLISELKGYLHKLYLPSSTTTSGENN